MPIIDNRLLDCASEPEITENFNRVLVLMDSAAAAVTALSTSLSELMENVNALKNITTRTVTFNSDGGTEVTAQPVVYGGVAVEPTAPTKEGYTFGGWYNGETSYSFASEVKADTTLTAHWTQNG